MAQNTHFFYQRKAHVKQHKKSIFFINDTISEHANCHANKKYDQTVQVSSRNNSGVVEPQF